MKKIEFTPAQEQKFIEYYSMIIKKAKSDLKDFTEVSVPEYWARYLGDYSVYDKEHEPFVNSYDVYPPVTTYTCTSLESRFNGAVRDSQKIVKITCAKHPTEAQRTEDWINNKLKKEVGFNDVTGDGFQRDIVEGLLTIYPNMEEKFVPRVRYEKEKGLKGAINYVVDKATALFKKKDEGKKRRKLKWDLVKATDLIYSSGAESPEKAAFIGHKLHYNFYDLKEKKNDWKDTDKVFEKLGQKNPNYNPNAEESPTAEEETKQQYFMLPSDMIKEYDGLYAISGKYHIENEVKDVCFVINVDLGILHEIYENENIEKMKYAIGQCFRIAGQMAGQGLPKRMAELNDLLAELFILILNNAKMTAATGGKFKGMGKGFDPGKLDLNKWMEVTDPEGGLRQWELGNKTMDLEGILTIVIGFLEKIGNVNDSTMGLMNSSNVGATARGTLAVIQEYAKNIGLLIKNFQETLRKAVYISMMLKYQYMTPEEEKEDEVSRSDFEYIDEMDIELIGEAVAAMDQYKKQILLMLYEKFSLDQSGEIDLYKIKEAIFDEFAPDLKAQGALRTPEMIQKIQTMMQMIQQKAQEIEAAKAGLEKQAIILKAESEAMQYEKTLRQQGVAEENIAAKVEEYRNQWMANEYPKYINNPQQQPAQPQAAPTQGQQNV